MEKFVVDANLFFNMEAGFDLGKKTDEVIGAVTGYAKKLKGRAEFFMPPPAVAEFLSFFKDKEQPQIKELFSLIVVRSPNRNNHVFSAGLFYQLIDEIRRRSYRGLSLGEEAINKAGELMMGAPGLDKKNFEIKIGPAIKNFRERYRQATRTGFLDSVADLDLIVLTKEVDGSLVSSDEGVINWGRFFGIKEEVPSSFRSKLDSLLRRG